ncbi:MAG: ATP-binding protein [Ferruginibacter sp.]
MNKISLLFFFLILSNFVQSQAVTRDEKKLAEGRLKPDSNFVNYLFQLASAYDQNILKGDSAGAFWTEGLMDADKINYTNNLFSPRENLSQYYFLKGRFASALSLLQKNEAVAIEQGDSLSLFNTLRLIATIYLRTGDLDMLHQYLYRRQLILDNNGIKNLKDTSYPVLSQYNLLGHYFSLPKINKPDSVEYFYRKIIFLGKKTAMKNLWEQLGSGGMGTYFFSQGLYDSSIYYYKIAQAAALAGNRTDNYYGFLTLLAKSYQKMEMPDSAFRYAYKVYDTATRYGYLVMVSSSANILADLYKDQHKYDSAVKYMGLAQQYKDSVVGQDALKSIQSLTSEQQMREQEKKQEKEDAIREYQSSLKNYLFIAGLLLLLLIIGFMYRVNNQRTQSKKKIESAYNELKATQAQLIQSEKMASLGELTAGIAHEIQNPLNFVNNFSEINTELISELVEEVDKRNLEEVKTIANDIKENSEKINHHGKRADAIVKGMLQHSRSSNGVKEPTEINDLCDEYLRLSYHGLRARDKSFNATMNTDFDQSIGKINIIPQDIGRVLLNLYNNAFYAVNEKLKAQSSQLTANYKPAVTISTKKLDNKIKIVVTDNGNGIPQNIIDKIFQPFFTTKPTGQGTGLGLSLCYDIVKAHGGEMRVESNEGEGSLFIIQLPVS